MLTARFLSPRVLSEKAFDALIGRMARDFCTDRISCEISWNGLQGAVETDDIIETSQCHLLQKCQRPLPLACQRVHRNYVLGFLAWHQAASQFFCRYLFEVVKSSIYSVKVYAKKVGIGVSLSFHAVIGMSSSLPISKWRFASFMVLECSMEWCSPDNTTL